MVLHPPGCGRVGRRRTTSPVRGPLTSGPRLVSKAELSKGRTVEHAPRTPFARMETVTASPDDGRQGRRQDRGSGRHETPHRSGRDNGHRDHGHRDERAAYRGDRDRYSGGGSRGRDSFRGDSGRRDDRAGRTGGPRDDRGPRSGDRDDRSFRRDDRGGGFGDRSDSGFRGGSARGG